MFPATSFDSFGLTAQQHAAQQQQLQQQQYYWQQQQLQQQHHSHQHQTGPAQMYHDPSYDQHRRLQSELMESGDIAIHPSLSASSPTRFPSHSASASSSLANSSSSIHHHHHPQIRQQIMNSMAVSPQGRAALLRQQQHQQQQFALAQQQYAYAQQQQQVHAAATAHLPHTHRSHAPSSARSNLDEYAIAAHELMHPNSTTLLSRQDQQLETTSQFHEEDAGLDEILDHDVLVRDHDEASADEESSVRNHLRERKLKERDHHHSHQHGSSSIRHSPVSSGTVTPRESEKSLALSTRANAGSFSRPGGTQPIITSTLNHTHHSLAGSRAQSKQPSMAPSPQLSPRSTQVSSPRAASPARMSSAGSTAGIAGSSATSDAPLPPPQLSLSSLDSPPTAALADLSLLQQEFLSLKDRIRTLRSTQAEKEKDLKHKQEEELKSMKDNQLKEQQRWRDTQTRLFIEWWAKVHYAQLKNVADGKDPAVALAAIQPPKELLTLSDGSAYEGLILQNANKDQPQTTTSSVNGDSSASLPSASPTAVPANAILDASSSSASSSSSSSSSSSTLATLSSLSASLAASQTENQLLRKKMDELITGLATSFQQQQQQQQQQNISPTQSQSQSFPPQTPLQGLQPQSHSPLHFPAVSINNNISPTQQQIVDKPVDHPDAAGHQESAAAAAATAAANAQALLAAQIAGTNVMMQLSAQQQDAAADARAASSGSPIPIPSLYDSEGRLILDPPPVAQLMIHLNDGSTMDTSRTHHATVQMSSSSTPSHPQMQSLTLPNSYYQPAPSQSHSSLHSRTMNNVGTPRFARSRVASLSPEQTAAVAVAAAAAVAASNASHPPVASPLPNTAPSSTTDSASPHPSTLLLSSLQQLLKEQSAQIMQLQQEIQTNQQQLANTQRNLTEVQQQLSQAVDSRNSLQVLHSNTTSSFLAKEKKYKQEFQYYRENLESLQSKFDVLSKAHEEDTKKFQQECLNIRSDAEIQYERYESEISLINNEHQSHITTVQALSKERETNLLNQLQTLEQTKQKERVEALHHLEQRLVQMHSDQLDALTMTHAMILSDERKERKSIAMKCGLKLLDILFRFHRHAATTSALARWQMRSVEQLAAKEYIRGLKQGLEKGISTTATMTTSTANMNMNMNMNTTGDRRHVHTHHHREGELHTKIHHHRDSTSIEGERDEPSREPSRISVASVTREGSSSEEEHSPVGSGRRDSASLSNSQHASASSYLNQSYPHSSSSLHSPPSSSFSQHHSFHTASTTSTSTSSNSHSVNPPRDSSHTPKSGSVLHWHRVVGLEKMSHLTQRAEAKRLSRGWSIWKTFTRNRAKQWQDRRDKERLKQLEAANGGTPQQQQQQQQASADLPANATSTVLLQTPAPPSASATLRSRLAASSPPAVEPPRPPSLSVAALKRMGITPMVQRPKATPTTLPKAAPISGATIPTPQQQQPTKRTPSPVAANPKRVSFDEVSPPPVNNNNVTSPSSASSSSSYPPLPPLPLSPVSPANSVTAAAAAQQSSPSFSRPISSAQKLAAAAQTHAPAVASSPPTTATKQSVTSTPASAATQTSSSVSRSSAASVPQHEQDPDNFHASLLAVQELAAKFLTSTPAANAATGSTSVESPSPAGHSRVRALSNGSMVQSLLQAQQQHQHGAATPSGASNASASATPTSSTSSSVDIGLELRHLLLLQQHELLIQHQKQLNQQSKLEQGPQQPTQQQQQQQQRKEQQQEFSTPGKPLFKAPPHEHQHHVQLSDHEEKSSTSSTAVHPSSSSSSSGALSRPPPPSKHDNHASSSVYPDDTDRAISSGPPRRLNITVSSPAAASASAATYVNAKANAPSPAPHANRSTASSTASSRRSSGGPYVYEPPLTEKQLSLLNQPSHMRPTSRHMIAQQQTTYEQNQSSAKKTALRAIASSVTSQTYTSTQRTRR